MNIIYVIFAILMGLFIPLVIVFLMGPRKIIRCIACKKFKSLAFIYAHDQELDIKIYEIGRKTGKDSYYDTVEKRLFCKRCRITDKLTR